MSIRALIFDLGRTLVPFEPELGLAAWSRLSGHAPEEVRSRFVDSGLYPRYERGELTTAEFEAAVKELLECEVSREEFAMAWSAIFLPETLVEEEWLEQWRKRYRLVLLSNTNELHFRYIEERYPVVRHFDEYVLSYEVGAMKPDERIYRAAVKAAGCEAEECFFTDDIEEYVEGARGYGIQGARFEGAAELRRELERRGVRLDE